MRENDERGCSLDKGVRDRGMWEECGGACPEIRMSRWQKLGPEAGTRLCSKNRVEDVYDPQTDCHFLWEVFPVLPDQVNSPFISSCGLCTSLSQFTSACTPTRLKTQGRGCWACCQHSPPAGDKDISHHSTVVTREEGSGRGQRVKGVKQLVMEGDLTGWRTHTMQNTDNVLCISNLYNLSNQCHPNKFNEIKLK